MENSENRDLTMAGVTDQNTFFEPQKARNPSKYWGFWSGKFAISKSVSRKSEVDLEVDFGKTLLFSF